MAVDSITFIGGGNMARSLIAGLIRQGVPATHIHVAEPVAALRESLAADFDVQVHDNAADAAAQGNTWLLAVKPQVLRDVCQSLQALAQANRPLVVSIAAGITSAQLERWLGGNLPVVRAMPNTPALLGAGVTGLYATASVDAQQHARAEQVLASAGRTVWIDSESLMDSVTAVSGSGPAYVFAFLEAMQSSGEKLGLDAATARKLAYATLEGATQLAHNSDEHAGVLRERVTSKGGTTAAALDMLKQLDWHGALEKAIDAASQRGKAMGDELGKN